MATDRSIVQIVVLVLGVVALASLGIMGVLSYQAKTIPEAIVAALSGSLGAIAALLAKTSTEPAP